MQFCAHPSRVRFERRATGLLLNFEETSVGLLPQVGSGIQHDGQGRDVIWFDVPIHQEAIAVFGYVVAEHVGRRDGRARAQLEKGCRRAA